MPRTIELPFSPEDVRAGRVATEAPDVVERVARAICRANNMTGGCVMDERPDGEVCDDRNCNSFAQARAALAAMPAGAVPEGWRLVPAEPTDAMLLCGGNYILGPGSDFYVSPDDQARHCYAKMLAASPIPPAAPQGEHEWIDFEGVPCCKFCGIVRRRDGKNKPCKGVVHVGLRDAAPIPPAAPQGERAPACVEHEERTHEGLIAHLDARAEHVDSATAHLLRCASEALSDEARIRREALLEAAKVAEADNGLAPHGGGNMDYGPNVARRIAAALRALAGELPPQP